MQLGNITINQYYCRWYKKEHGQHDVRRKVLHSSSISAVIEKAKHLYGRKPDEILLLR
jgi:hypothetical protein